jgi:hypothetical protein
VVAPSIDDTLEKTRKKIGINLRQKVPDTKQTNNEHMSKWNTELRKVENFEI